MSLHILRFLHHRYNSLASSSSSRTYAGAMPSAASSASSSLSVIDLSPFHPSSDDFNNIRRRRDVAASLIAACKESGFVYVVNHGVSPSSVAEAFAWSKKLFDLSEEDKMKAPHPSGGAVHRGYSTVGREQVAKLDAVSSVSDYKESYEIGSEQNADQPNVWLPPDVLPGFKEFNTKFYAECHEASLRVLQAIGLGLDLPDPDFFLKSHSGIGNQLRLAHYPAVETAGLEDGRMTRIAPHTDWSSITMLFQDDCGGLKIENPSKEGEYVSVPPLTNSLVLNVGDLLQHWSNDTLKSSRHTVGAPPLQGSDTPGDRRVTRERYSIPYFIAPDGDTIIECLPTCTGEGRPAKYEPIKQRDWNIMKATQMMG